MTPSIGVASLYFACYGPPLKRDLWRHGTALLLRLFVLFGRLRVTHAAAADPVSEVRACLAEPGAMALL